MFLHMNRLRQIVSLILIVLAKKFWILRHFQNALQWAQWSF